MATSEYLADAQTYNPPSSPDLSFYAYRTNKLGYTSNYNWINGAFGRLFHANDYKDWVQNELNNYNREKEAYDINFQNSYQTYAADLERRRAAGMNGYYTDGVGGMQSAQPGHFAEYDANVQNDAAAGVFNAITKGMSSFMGFAQGLQGLKSLAADIKGKELDNVGKEIQNQYLSEYLANRNNNMVSKYLLNHMNAARLRWYLFGNSTPDGSALQIMDTQPGVLEELYNDSPYVRGITANLTNQETMTHYNAGVYDDSGIDFIKSMRTLQQSSAKLDLAVQTMDTVRQQKFFTFLEREIALYSARLANDTTGEIQRGKTLQLDEKVIERDLKKFGFDNFVDYAGDILGLIGSVIGMTNTSLRTGAIMKGVNLRGQSVPQMQYHKRLYKGDNFLDIYGYDDLYNNW